MNPNDPASMKRRFLAVLGGVFLSTGAFAAESDVHFGLTKWLTMKAGFPERQADFIATGNQRVDSGSMSSLEFVLQYACSAKLDELARMVKDRHFPSAGPLPAAPQKRVVVAGDDAARREVAAMLNSVPQQAGFLLIKFGESLHPLQDSYFHQGVPDVPAPEGIECDATRANANPKARGGWNSHKADITRYWPADTVAMARATYEALNRYPLAEGAARTPQEWNTIRPLLDGFVQASTKTEKKAWFVKQGFGDVSFLEPISLQDGAERWTAHWNGHRIPPLPNALSAQRGHPADVVAFFNELFPAWMKASDLDELARRYAPREVAKEVAARLKVWRIRDHGRVAEIAHARAPLDARLRAELDAVLKDPLAIAKYETPLEAVFPMLPKTEDSQPLAPFVLQDLAASNAGNPRVIAIVKLRHAPYDTVGLVGERTAQGWRLTSVVATIDH